MSAVYRIQDKDGRGPWRPGFSHKWVSNARDASMFLPPIYEEVPSFQKLVTLAHSMGLHIGVAVRGIDGISKWFLPSELKTLRGEGFYVVQCDNCRVLAETPNQLLIGSKISLRGLPNITWDHMRELIAEREAAA